MLFTCYCVTRNLFLKMKFYKYHTMYNPNSPWNTLLRLKNLPFGSISCILDQQLEEEVAEIINTVVDNRCLNDIDVQQKFLDRYRAWIPQTTLNTIRGLENFTVSAFSNGTTESFDKFYLKNKNRRLRYFKGEYMYHVVAAHAYFDQYAYIEDEPLAENDVVVFSLPFADTGNKHQDTEKVLKICDELDIPVMIDCCYFGVCRDIEFNFDHTCIDSVVFSLSKIFPVQHLRIGIRFTRIDDDDPLLVYNKNRYINRLGAAVGLELMNRYGPDYNQETYRNTQESFCQQLSVNASNCVFFGNSSNLFDEYNRGTDNNRLCFSKYLKSSLLPKN